jgi:hypothetical protein
MVLDTADALSSIIERAAARLALHTKEMPFHADVRFGNKSIRKVATAKGMSFGNAHINTVDLSVIPNDTIGTYQQDARIIGILGMDLLSHVDIELDTAHRKLNLFSQDHCPGDVVYWSDTYDSAPIRLGELGELYFPMDLDGKKIETALATGRTTTTLSNDVTRKLYNFDSHSPEVETEIDAAGNTKAHYRAMKISGQGIEIINARIALIDKQVGGICYLSKRAGAVAYDGCFGVHPLMLGRSVINKLHLYIATKEKMLYFTPAESVN